MNVSDPVADMLTRIRNAVGARHDSVQIPASKMKVAIAQVLKSEGFIRDFSIATEEGRPQPKPGLRVYVQQREIPRVYGGLGIAILSTPKGVMTGQEARRNQLGGEVLCYVW